MKSRCRGIASVILLIISICSLAQSRNNWISADWADAQWLDFGAVNPPTAVQHLFGPGDLLGFLGNISDTVGNLLIINHSNYSYNSSGQIIGGASTQWSPSMTPRGSIILPSHNGNKYGVFLTGQMQNSTLDCGYYEVDIAANNGDGEVLAPGALILEYNILTGVAATPHANALDYWIAYHADDSNTWYMYRYGVAGLDPMPVISQAGIDLFPDNIFDSQVKFSYAGDKLAFQTMTDTLELFEFDDATGVVQHLASLPTPGSSNGLEFSPSGQFLYMVWHFLDSGGVPSWEVLQWNVELPPGQIAASKTTVFSGVLQNGSGYNVGMLLAPDGRIYFPHDVTPYYSRIEYPDLQGTACTVVEDVVGAPPAELTGFINNHCKRYHDSEFSVGINEQTIAPAIELWPNPMRDNGWLYLPGFTGKVQLLWFDAMGRRVRVEERTATGNRLALDVSDLLPGHYSIQVIGTEQAVVSTLLVVE